VASSSAALSRDRNMSRALKHMFLSSVIVLSTVGMTLSLSASKPSKSFEQR
jgi:hypothetical protein